MEYNVETGKVVQILGEKAVVRIERAASAKCSSCCACSIGAAGERTLEVDRRDLGEGDIVEVRAPKVSGYLSILLLFGLPTLLFVVGGFVSLQAAIAGIAVAFFVAWLVNRRLAAKFPLLVQRIESPPDSKKGGPDKERVREE